MYTTLAVIVISKIRDSKLPDKSIKESVDAGIAEFT